MFKGFCMCVYPPCRVGHGDAECVIKGGEFIRLKEFCVDVNTLIELVHSLHFDLLHVFLTRDCIHTGTGEKQFYRAFIHTSIYIHIHVWLSVIVVTFCQHLKVVFCFSFVAQMFIVVRKILKTHRWATLVYWVTHAFQYDKHEHAIHVVNLSYAVLLLWRFSCAAYWHNKNRDN